MVQGTSGRIGDSPYDTFARPESVENSREMFLRAGGRGHHRLDIERYQLGIAEPGHYVDVGCNDPVRVPDTFELYMRGWRGLNIDANAALVKRCQRTRKQDISICAAVSDGVKAATFYRGKDDAGSTIDEERLVEWKKHFEFLSDQQTVVTRTLSSILDECWPYGSQFDLLTVDVEGHDLQVRKGLDLEKYRPKMIVVEMHSFERIVRDLQVLSREEVFAEGVRGAKCVLC